MGNHGRNIIKKYADLCTHRHIAACTNEYDIVHRLFSAGDWSVRGGGEIETKSPAMDTRVPYNVERYLWLAYGGDCAFVRRVMQRFERDGGCRLDVADGKLRSLVTHSFRVDASMTREVMRRCVRENAYLPCPHSATSMYGAMQMREEGVPVVAVSTAHPAKFPKICKEMLRGDSAAQEVYDRFMRHEFLPKEEEQKAFVVLDSTQCEDWKSQWVEILKADIRKMNDGYSLSKL